VAAYNALALEEACGSAADVLLTLKNGWREYFYSDDSEMPVTLALLADTVFTL